MGTPAAALGGGPRQRASDEVLEEGPRCEQRFTHGAPPRSLAMRLFGHGAELPGLSRPPGLRMLRQGREELVQGL
jgi:hypothetical protein